MGLVSGGGREELSALATQADTVDLIIPRGGEGLKAALSAVATVPVIYAASGNCHVYVDSSADLDVAEAIVLNAKTQRPGVCNAAETLLIHRDIAPQFLPRVLRSLGEAGVLIRADERTLALAPGGPDAARAGAGSTPSVVVEAAGEDDWATRVPRPDPRRSVSWTRWSRRSSTSDATAAGTPRPSSRATPALRVASSSAWMRPACM